jgi:ABC-type antimicrobial peptide transport system permease subunit
MIATYMIISIITIYIDNIMALSMSLPYKNLRYIYVSIRTIFVVGGVTLLLNQYYSIMKSSTKDYCILKALGATKINIRRLMYIQVVSLIIITIPLGLFLGQMLTNSLLHFFAAIIMNSTTVEVIDSSNTFLLVSGSLCGFIICIGIYLERGVRKMPLSNILSDYSAIGKGVR